MHVPCTIKETYLAFNSMYPCSMFMCFAMFFVLLVVRHACTYNMLYLSVTSEMGVPSWHLGPFEDLTATADNNNLSNNIGSNLEIHVPGSSFPLFSVLLHTHTARCGISCITGVCVCVTCPLQSRGPRSPMTVVVVLWIFQGCALCVFASVQRWQWHPCPCTGLASYTSLFFVCW